MHPRCTIFSSCTSAEARDPEEEVWRLEIPVLRIMITNEILHLQLHFRSATSEQQGGNEEELLCEAADNVMKISNVSYFYF